MTAKLPDFFVYADPANHRTYVECTGCWHPAAVFPAWEKVALSELNTAGQTHQCAPEEGTNGARV